VDDSILFAGVNIGRQAKIRHAIIDKGVCIPEGARVGYDEEEDRANGYVISPGGVVVIAKSEVFEPAMAESV
jgi:glucose-1-phosphate adenylyltransferase